MREPEGSHRAIGIEIECTAMGRCVPVLLAGDQLEKLAGEGRMLDELLPGMKADRVGELVVHLTASPKPTVAVESSLSMPVSRWTKLSGCSMCGTWPA